LVEQLGEKDAALRLPALSALGQLGPVGRKAAGRVAEVLNDPGEGPEAAQVPAAALGALLTLGGDARDVVPAVVKFLERTPGGPSLGTAADVLAECGADAREAVPALRRALKDPHVRVAAALAVWQVEGDARAGLPVLAEVLNDRSGPLARQREA